MNMINSVLIVYISQFLQKPNLHPKTRELATGKQKSFEFAVNFERSHKDEPYVFSPVNLGDGVNSAESEYFPCLPIDETEIIFTRRVRNANEDFYHSVKSSGKWNGPSAVQGGINTQSNEGAMTLSQDGQWLIYTACDRPGGYGSCDLYIAYRTNEGWSEPENLGGQVNTDQWDVQPSLSPDKQDLYFVSRRPGGYGGSDLYVTHRQNNGRWGTPENMGPEINSTGDEFSPFIHADNQTLYFTSNGLPGYGDHDIFVLRKKSDGRWGKPENLGYPINTIGHEGTLFITASGNTAYFASDRSDSKGGFDLYSFDLRKEFRPSKTLWIKGKVYDKKTSVPLASSVELIDLNSGTIISKVQTDQTGNYLITLPVGKDYVFNVNRKGYLFYSDNYSLINKNPDSTYNKDIALEPIEVNASVVLKNIFFDTRKYEIKSESAIELSKLVQLMNDNPTVALQIEGHTDNIGTDADNLKLSQARARSVMNYLIEHGISGKRLGSQGYGASRPIASNVNEQGRAQNRRTEMKVIAK